VALLSVVFGGGLAVAPCEPRVPPGVEGGTRLQVATGHAALYVVLSSSDDETSHICCSEEEQQQLRLEEKEQELLVFVLDELTGRTPRQELTTIDSEHRVAQLDA